MDYQEYFAEVWENLPLSVISYDYRARNKELLETMIYDFYRYDSMSADFDPERTSVILRNIFISIQKIGIR